MASIKTFGVAFAAAAAAASVPSTSVSASAACTAPGQPNPIAADYADKTTGVLNGTVVVVPVALAVARAAVPAEYTILEDAYTAFLAAGYPSFPEGAYPLLVQTGVRHDVKGPGGAVSDEQTFGLQFPFVDRLGDGTPFRYVPDALTSASADFAPDCAAYARVSATAGQVAFGVNATGTDGTDAQLSVHQTAQTPVTVDVFRNLTNQPAFAAVDGTCTREVRLWNPSVFWPSSADMTIAVTGTVAGSLVPVEQAAVRGFRLASPFIVDDVDCASLAGYTAATVRGY